MTFNEIVNYVESEGISKKFVGISSPEKLLEAIQVDRKITDIFLDLNRKGRETVFSQLLYRLEGVLYNHYGTVPNQDLAVCIYSYILHGVEYYPRHSSMLNRILDKIATGLEHHKSNTFYNSRETTYLFAPRLVEIMLR